MPRPPAKSQQTINFTRSNQLALKAKLRKHRLGKHGKSLFLLLDDHIGPNISWVLTYEELAEEAEISVNTVRMAIDALCELGVIWFEKVTDHYHERRLRFYITWANIEEMVEERMPTTPDIVAASKSPHCGANIHAMEDSSTPWSNPPHGATILHAVEDSIYRKNGRINVHSNGTPPTPSSAVSQTLPSLPDRRTEVVVKVRDAGVAQFGLAVLKAQAEGMTLDQIEAVVDHFNANPGRWPAEVLYERVTRPGASLQPADQGWYGEKLEWIATQKRAAVVTAQQQAKEESMRVENPNQRYTREQNEAKFGPILDAMTPAERHALLANRPAIQLQLLIKAERERNESALSVYRVDLINELVCRAAVSREQAERRAQMEADRAFDFGEDPDEEIDDA